MQKETMTNLILFFNVVILVFGIIFLFLNFNVISVIHAKASEWLPVQVYETYSTLETSFLYLLILLTVSNIISIKIRYLKSFKPYIISLTPIIAIISILLLFLNPHTMILHPNGWPPTRFDYIELGGIMIISGISYFYFVQLNSIVYVTMHQPVGYIWQIFDLTGRLIPLITGCLTFLIGVINYIIELSYRKDKIT